MPRLPVPDTTSAEALEQYSMGTKIAGSKGPAWEGIRISVMALPRAAETYTMPAVTEPFIAWISSGEADFLPATTGDSGRAGQGGWLRMGIAWVVSTLQVFEVVVFLKNASGALGRPILAACVVAFAGLAGCRNAPRTFVPRKGDEIVVAGRLFHTGTRVITWMDPGGYDAYRVERRFSPYAESGWEQTQKAAKEITSPNRYGLRAAGLAPEAIEKVRGGGWELSELQQVVDQFVLHYDAAGLSKVCFEALQDQRGLSVHFLLDIDGTIYQTLDLKERAWHATTANSRAIGVEIAQVGAFAPGDTTVSDKWYCRDDQGRAVITIPPDAGAPMIHTKGFTGRPARPEPVRGNVQGQDLVQYDFTPEQYEALTKLTAALCTVFPRIKCDYPRDADGRLITVKLPDEQLVAYHGVLGHYHVQANKTDPGPALQWDRVIGGAREMLRRN